MIKIKLSKRRAREYFVTLQPIDVVIGDVEIWDDQTCWIYTDRTYMMELFFDTLRDLRETLIETRKRWIHTHNV